MFMNEHQNDIQLEHTIAITKLQGDVEGLKEKVADLNDIKVAVTELTLLQKQQIEYNKKFNEMYEKAISNNIEFSSTLKNINDNLNALNGEIKGTNKRIDLVEDKITKIDEKSKVDILKIFRDWTPKLLLGGLTFYFLQLSGLIK
jgi:predicted nuclease with TOPRIM domain